MNPETATWNREDRDLLVELRTTLASVQRDIKEIKDGTSAKISFLETDKLSRSEAVRLNNENLSKHTEYEETLKANDKRITTLEDSRIEYRATIKAWVIIGGGIWTLATIIFSVWLATKF